MKFFLRFVNPILALTVLVICLVAASAHGVQGKFTYVGFFQDPFSTYFLAKGIFCSTALFLLGKITERAIRTDPGHSE